MDMSASDILNVDTVRKPIRLLFIGLAAVGLVAFVIALKSPHPARAWQAYLINFLLWSGIAQGALVFPALMHLAKARWSRPLSGLADAFAAFFAPSFVLFLLLFLGATYIFPWQDMDLHGKEVWLNIPFLFWRDFTGLVLLYGFGFGFLYYDLQERLGRRPGRGRIRLLLYRRWNRGPADIDRLRRRKSIFSVLYILAFALVLSLIGYDLIMSMDPHWISTLFGAYIFVKSFYIGLGALIILAAVMHRRMGEHSPLTPAHFHDLGKLFFAFCLVWADFLYAQLVVIWYGNISEEAGYVIERTMLTPWRSLAWTVFVVCFVTPFLILLNRRIKTRPAYLSVLSAVVIAGIWLEHLLLLGPALSHGASVIPLGPMDGLITLGFLGLMATAVSFFLNTFPEVAWISDKEMD